MMIRWTKIDSDFMQKEAERQHEAVQCDIERRKIRAKRIVKSILVPAGSGLAITIFALLTFNWGSPKVGEHLASRRAKNAILQKENEQEQKLAAYKGRLNDQDRSAKEILIKAYKQEEEKERREKEKLAAASTKEPVQKKQTATERRKEIEVLEKDILISIQQKEFADYALIVAVEAKEHAERQFRLTEKRRKNLQRELNLVTPKRERIEKEYAQLLDQNAEKNEIVEQALEKKEILNQESIQISEDKDSLNKNLLLDTIEKLEQVDRQAKTAIQDLESLKGKIDLAITQKRELEKKEKELVSELDSAKQEEKISKNEKLKLEKDLIVAGNTKTTTEIGIETKLASLNQIHLELLSELKNKGRSDLIERVKNHRKKFNTTFRMELRNLQYEEGRHWQKRAQTLLKEKDFFSSKVIIGQILNLYGPGIIGDQKSSEVEDDYPDIPQLIQTLRKGSTFHPIWQSPVESAENSTTSLSFSPDGRVLALGVGDTIKIWRLDAQIDQVDYLMHPQITDLCFSPDGKFLASSSADSTVILWNSVTQEQIRTLKGPDGAIRRISIDSESSRLATGGDDGTISVWDVASEKEPLFSQKGKASINALAFSKARNLLISNGEGGTIDLWDLSSGKIVKSLEGHKSSVTDLKISPEDGVLLSSSLDTTVRFWDLTSAKEIAVLESDSGIVSQVEYSPDGQTIALGTDLGVELWDVELKTKKAVLRGNSSAIESINFSPDSKTLAASSLHSIRLWNVVSGLENIDPVNFENKQEFWTSKKEIEGHSKAVIGLCFSNDNRLMASASRDKTIKIWDTRTGWDTQTLEGHSKPVLSVCFSHDDEKLLSASLDSKVKVWDPNTGNEISTVALHKGAVYSVACSPDNGTVASGGKDKLVKLWDITTGSEKKELRGHQSTVISVGFDTTGTKLVSSSKDGEIKIWDVKLGQEITTLLGHSDAVFDVQFSPDGSIIASASKDKTIKIWDVELEREIVSLNGHVGTIYGVSFSPNGQKLASASKDGITKIWDLFTGQEIVSMAGNGSPVFNVAYSFDGNSLAIGNDNGSITYCETDRRKEFNFEGYSSWFKIENFQINWEPVSQTSSFVNVSPKSHVGLLNSDLEEDDETGKLFWLYSRSEGWNGMMALFHQLPESMKKEAEVVLAEKLKWNTKNAIDRGLIGVAGSRMEQWGKIKQSISTNLEFEYLILRKNYLQRSYESRNQGFTITEHPQFSEIGKTLIRLSTEGLHLTALKIANDFDFEILTLLPSNFQNLESVTAAEWLENAWNYKDVNIIKAVNYCLRAIEKNPNFVESYQAPPESPEVDFVLACAYGSRAGVNSKELDGSTTVNKDLDIRAAINRLKLAKEKGWEDWNRVESEKFLDSIRADPQYQEYVGAEYDF